MKLADLYMAYSRIQGRCPAQILTDGFTLRSIASHSAHFVRLGWLKRVGSPRDARFIRLLDREEFEAAYDANLHAVLERKNSRIKTPRQPTTVYHGESFVHVRAKADLETVEELRQQTTIMGLFRQMGVR